MTLTSTSCVTSAASSRRHTLRATTLKIHGPCRATSCSRARRSPPCARVTSCASRGSAGVSARGLSITCLASHSLQRRLSVGTAVDVRKCRRLADGRVATAVEPLERYGRHQLRSVRELRMNLADLRRALRDRSVEADEYGALRAATGVAASGDCARRVGDHRGNGCGEMGWDEDLTVDRVRAVVRARAVAAPGLRRSDKKPNGDQRPGQPKCNQRSPPH
jgi:hypothetical protein